MKSKSLSFHLHYNYFFEGVKMKNLGIKLFSVLVILLFCLSPLGAIDLGHGDNATHINDNNGTDIKDVNDTIKVNDSDVEIKSVNDTAVDLDNDENDVECKDLSFNDTNSSKKLKGYDVGLHAKVDDCYYGQSPVLKIWVTDEYFGHANVDISVSGNGYHEEFSPLIEGKNNQIKLNDSLSPGTYVVTVKFGDKYGYYNNVTVSDFFTVKKNKISLKAHVDDVELGKTPVLRVTSEKGLNGNVTIYSNWSGEKFTVDASHESFSYELDRNMAPGNYCCMVTYSGDDTHDAAVSAGFFSVNKHDPNATVDVDDIVQGDDIFMKFHANKALNCDVKYVVLTVPSSPSNSSLKDGSIMHVKLVNGEANATLENSLGPGRYFVAGTVEGDDNFKAADFYKEFKVNPAN